MQTTQTLQTVYKVQTPAAFQTLQTAPSDILYMVVRLSVRDFRGLRLFAQIGKAFHAAALAYYREIASSARLSSIFYRHGDVGPMNVRAYRFVFDSLAADETLAPYRVPWQGVERWYCVMPHKRITMWYHVLHRGNDLPAVVSTKGGDFSYEWYVCDVLHRDGDKPARILANGRQEWWRYGLLHRDGGLAAVVDIDGYREWWTDGVNNGKQ